MEGGRWRTPWARNWEVKEGREEKVQVSRGEEEDGGEEEEIGCSTCDICVRPNISLKASSSEEERNNLDMSVRRRLGRCGYPCNVRFNGRSNGDFHRSQLQHIHNVRH